MNNQAQPFDFEKLKRGDEVEWQRFYPLLFARVVNVLNANFWDSSSLDLPAIAAHTVAASMAECAGFTGLKHLEASTLRRAHYLANDEYTKSHAQKRGGGKVSSLDEEGVESEYHGSPRMDAPNVGLQDAEIGIILREAGCAPADLSLLVDSVIDEMKHREIGLKYGWDERSVGNRINQAKRRVQKVLNLDPRMAEIINVLEINRIHE